MSEEPLSCCDTFERLDFSKASIPELDVNWSDRHLVTTVAIVVINNVLWHLVALFESRTHRLSDLWQSPQIACYAFAFMYLAMVYKQEVWFKAMLHNQPKWTDARVQNNNVLYLGYTMTVMGLVFLVTAFRSLKFTGTFLGAVFGTDHHKVSSDTFPYQYPRQVLAAGSVLFHCGLSCASACQAGFLVTLLIGLGHIIALFIKYKRVGTELNTKKNN